MIIFDANSLLKLMVHYSDGQVPLNATLKGAGISATLQRWIGLDVESDEWDGELAPDGGLYPLHFRYEGKKVLSWNNKREEPKFGEAQAVEKPRQA